MDDFLAARLQMALSLGFHIVYACIGMVMPFFMAVAHFQWLKTGEALYKNVTKAWSKGVAIFFATGAVSGTMLSFELGLLWPEFMLHAGPVFGMPFSLEGTAFFIEAIALGFFLYGWDRLDRWFHWFTGVVVGLSGLASGILVVSANAWMNSPAGFDHVGGKFINIDPIAAMLNDAWFTQALHMCLAAFAATGFAVAGIHALMILRNRNVAFHATAFRIAALFGAVAALLQPVSGDLSARDVADRQPAKFAAMEAHFHTAERVPLLLGGIPDAREEKVKYAIEIPGLLSFLAHGDFDAEVTGLDRIPADERPPVGVVHIAFQVMVGIGVLLVVVAVLFLISFRKDRWINRKWLLWLFVVAIPLGFIAIEAGWTVTEVGRQPWIIQDVMKTKDALTPMPGIIWSLLVFTIVYLTLSAMAVFLLYRQIAMVPVLYDRPKQDA